MSVYLIETQSPKQRRSYGHKNKPWIWIYGPFETNREAAAKAREQHGALNSNRRQSFQIVTEEVARARGYYLKES